MSFDPRQQTHPASITTSNFQLCMLLYLLNHFHDYLFMAWNGHFFSFVMICFNVGLILFFRLFTYLVNSTVLTYFYLWEWLQWIYNILICYVPLFPHFLASLVWKNSFFFFFLLLLWSLNMLVCRILAFLFLVQCSFYFLVLLWTTSFSCVVNFNLILILQCFVNV